LKRNYDNKTKLKNWIIFLEMISNGYKEVIFLLINDEDNSFPEFLFGINKYRI
jgi:hypothetical protein